MGHRAGFRRWGPDPARTQRDLRPVRGWLVGAAIGRAVHDDETRRQAAAMGRLTRAGVSRSLSRRGPRGRPGVWVGAKGPRRELTSSRQ